MAAYVVVQVEVQDQSTYDEYRKLVKPTLDAYGGRFLVRGGNPQTLEGTWKPARFVILEFDSVEQARRWWESPEYTPAKVLRQKSAKTEMIVVEGV
ncbi:MAG TPA: DUF1330 domain-containing protein [Terriglobales bacterium]|nr:DUF1330 domain-containing protein [Terriglobales bacterium]